MKKLLSAASLIAFILVFAGISFADSTTGSLGVTATVVSVCTVSTSPVNFGDVTGVLSVDATGDITVNCPAGLPYNIALDAGQHIAANLERRVAGGGSYYVEYLISKPDYSGLWGDSDYANTWPIGTSFADTGTGANQPHSFNASLPSFSGIPPGTVLMDTVTVTVHY